MLFYIDIKYKNVKYIVRIFVNFNKETKHVNISDL